MTPPPDQMDLLEKLLPWLSDFCTANGFNRPDGLSNVSRAMTLAGGATPKTKKESTFLVALLTEIARRFPGAEYSTACPLPPIAATRLVH